MQVRGARAGDVCEAVAVQLLEPRNGAEMRFRVLGQLLERGRHAADATAVRCPVSHARRITMTDVASAPAMNAPAAVKPINHWISGSVQAGRSGRTGRVFNPATG